MKPILSLPTRHFERAVELRKQIDSSESELAALFGGDQPETEPAPPHHTDAIPAPKRRGRPPGARSGATTETADTGKPPRPARTFTPEGRARIAAAQKARWAAYHKAKGE